MEIKAKIKTIATVYTAASLIGRVLEKLTVADNLEPAELTNLAVASIVANTDATEIPSSQQNG